MRSVFDTTHAAFDQDQVAILLAAYAQARNMFGDAEFLPDNTKRKLAKIIISRARDRIAQHDQLDASELASEAAAFLRDLRSMALLA